MISGCLASAPGALGPALGFVAGYLPSVEHVLDLKEALIETFCCSEFGDPRLQCRDLGLVFRASFAHSIRQSSTNGLDYRPPLTRRA
jgi:hypothetical protein